MKRLVPKAKLEWKEPKAIRTARDDMDAKSLSPWFKPGVVLFSAAFLMLSWWLAKQNPSKTPPSLQNALLLALFGGAFFAYGIPWMLSFCPSYIRIFDHGISRVIGNSASLWKFKDIDRCELASVTTGDITQSALVIHTNKAKRIVLGLPAELASQAKQVLLDMNVRIDEIAQQSNSGDSLKAAPDSYRWARTEMIRKLYLLPTSLVTAHLILVGLVWAYVAVSKPSEPGAVWESVVGTIDFATYYLFAVPQRVASAGVSSTTSCAYPLWFAFTGSIQWLILGLTGALILKRKKPNQSQQLTSLSRRS